MFTCRQIFLCFRLIHFIKLMWENKVINSLQVTQQYIIKTMLVHCERVEVLLHRGVMMCFLCSSRK